MAQIDVHAAEVVRDFREDAGLSVEGLASAIQLRSQQEGWFKIHGAVDAFTLRRIEATGHCPSERVRFVIAHYFGVGPRDIWQPRNRRKVAA